jgi:hypothetical protein
MTACELQRIGRKVFGHDWQASLGRCIGVHRITAWRWATKKTPIPEDKAAAIRQLVIQPIK